MGIFDRFGRPNVAKLLAKRDVAGLAAALADRELRPQAIGALAEIGDAAAVEPLLDLVGQHREPTGVRGLAMRALGRIGSRVADPSLRATLVECLLSYRMLTVRFGAPDPVEVTLARESAEALLALGDAAIAPLIASLDRDRGYDRSREAIQMLARIGGPAFDRVLSALRRPELRHGAARTLGRLRDPRAIDPLLEMLVEPPDCDAAAEALAAIGDVRAVEPLVAALATHARDLFYSSKIAKALQEFGPLSEPALIELLAHADAPVRAAAAGALIEIATEKSVAALAIALGDSQTPVAEAAAKALDRLGWRPSEASQRVTTAIATERWAEVATLGAVAVPALLEALSKARGGARRELREDLLRVLGEVGDATAVEALFLELVDGPGRRPEVTREDLLEEVAERALTQVLRRDGKKVATDVLRRIQALEDPTFRFWPTRDNEIFKGHGQFEATIKLADLRAAARQELERRGTTR